MKLKELFLAILGCVMMQMQAVSQSNYKGFIPDSCSYMVISQPSRTTKYSQLVYGNNFKYPFLMADGAMLLLSDDEVKTPVVFGLPIEIQNPDESFVIDNMLLLRQGNVVRSYDGKKVEKLFERKEEKFKIYPANNDSFYYIKHEQDSSFAYLFDLATEKFTKLFAVPFHIDCFVGSGREAFLSSGEMIYFVSDEIQTLVEVADSRVQSIDFFSEGAFFSTEKACYYLGLPGKSYPFLLGDIKQVMLVDNRLYLLFRNGLLSVIDHANQYQTLLDEVVNEVNKNEDEKH